MQKDKIIKLDEKTIQGVLDGLVWFSRSKQATELYFHTFLFDPLTQVKQSLKLDAVDGMGKLIPALGERLFMLNAQKLNSDEAAGIPGFKYDDSLEEKTLNAEEMRQLVAKTVKWLDCIMFNTADDPLLKSALGFASDRLARIYLMALHDDYSKATWGEGHGE